MGASRLVNLKSTLVAVWPQVIATIISSMAYLSIGLVRAWASTSVPSLNLNVTRGVLNEFVMDAAPFDPEIISWVVSLLPFGAICGSLISSLPLNKFGRRPTLFLAGFIFMIANLLIGLADLNSSIAMVLVGRCIAGIGVGISVPSAVIYISEVVSPHLRGTFGCIPALLLALGVLIGYVVGAFLPWHKLAYVSIVPPCLLMAGMVWLPESPVWLKRAGKEEQAEKILKWFNPVKASIELQTLPSTPVDTGMKYKAREAELNNNPEEVEQGLVKEEVKQIKEETQEDNSRFFSRGVIHPLVLSMVLMFTQSWCGVNVLVFKTVEIFNAVGSSVDDYVATAIVGIVQLLATAISVSLVDKAGRRILLMISSATMVVSMSVLGACFYVKGNGELPTSIGWLPLVAIIIAFLGYSAGFAGIPFLIMGELFPSKYRNICGSISSTFNLTTLFLLLKFFTAMAKAMSFHGIFWLYAAVSLFGTVFVFLFLPETKGKNLKEIEEHFSGKGKQTSPWKR